MAGGDTLYIDGDSHTNPGTQAQYEIGYDDTGHNLTPGCSTSYPYDCTLGNLPAGSSSSARTSIIGTGTHKPQLWGTQRVWQVLNASNDHLLLQWLEITDHDTCTLYDPSNGCAYPGTYPNGPWAEDGIDTSGDDVNMTDVYVHGLARYGIITGNMGSATFTRLYLIGNGSGGLDTNTSATVSGTITLNQPIVEWNGCQEATSISSIDDPSNYSNCAAQDSTNSLQPDGISFGNNGTAQGGSWTIVGPGSISFNTQDGFDLKHSDGSGTIQIDKMRFEGNAGQAIKTNAQTVSLTNSIIFGDCNWWYGASQSVSGGMQPPDGTCRALGNPIETDANSRASDISSFYNNTIVSYGDVTIDIGGTCDSSDMLIFKNNILYGGYAWADDTTFNPGASSPNALTAYYDIEGCNNEIINEDYNIVTGTRNNNAGCRGDHDKCGTNPSFTGTIPTGTAGGGASTYYQGLEGVTLVGITNNSPPAGAGTAGLTYWNTENDYYNVTRPSPPSMGGLEPASCAASGYLCFYNSDCCSGSCSNNACTGSPPPPSGTPVFSISGKSFLNGKINL